MVVAVFLKGVTGEGVRLLCLLLVGDGGGDLLNLYVGAEVSACLRLCVQCECVCVCAPPACFLVGDGVGDLLDVGLG